MDKLFPEKGNIFLYLILGLGWACLVMSLIFQTISFVKTSKLIQTSIANIEKITVSTTLDEVATNEDEYYENWRKSNKKIDRGNKISFWFMLVGIFCIVLCAFTSLILKDKTSNQPFPEINIILKDTLTNNTYNMSKAKQSGDSSKKAPNNKQPNQVRNVKVVREGKLTVKQSQQIVAPPIKTNPKK